MAQRRTVPAGTTEGSPRSSRLPRNRWRRAAWKLALRGRTARALALQRAVCAAPGRRQARDDLRDRFRLLRWEMAAGEWRQALEVVETLCLRLAQRRMLAGPAAGWVFLARAVAQFHLGHGPRARRSMAVVLRSARGGPAVSLTEAALRVAGTWRRLRSGADAGWVASGPQGERRRPAGGGDGAPAAEDPEADSSSSAMAGRNDPAGLWRARARQCEEALLPILDGSWPAASFPARWTDVPETLEGPPEAAVLAAALVRIERRSFTGQGEAAPGERLFPEWLARSEEGRAATPPWLVPILARLAEERAPEAEPSERLRIHAAVSRLAAQVAEPWARVEALAARAEIALWVGTDPGERGQNPLSEARADLGLACGLLRRLGWSARTRSLEARWMRLAVPALGQGVREPGAPAPGRSLAWVRRNLEDSGFLTADVRLLRELAPLALLAPTPLPVLILGESGTGKEVLARALHRWSRLKGECVAIHCGAIPRDLLESELFGHTRGAFTGAAADKQGLVESADGGSLFLDEIGEMGMEAQMKMLRVLESGEVRRLGDLRPRRARIRLIAATHRDLEEGVRSGAFRLDLFHRIRGVVVRLRPLRERRGDIPLLASRVLAEAGDPAKPLRLPESTLARLLAYDWPGNVRELRGCLLRGAHLARALGTNALEPDLVEVGTGDGDRGVALPLEDTWNGELPSREAVERSGLEAVLDEMERRLIRSALEECRWNRTHAARSLGGISRTTLISKMKRLGIVEEGAGAGY